MKQVTSKLGPLTVRVVDDETRGGPPDLVVVLCHGYGAPGSDLVGIAGEVLSIAPQLAGRVRFVFPEAPLSLDDVPFGGRAWWHIDMERLQRAMMSGDVARDLEAVPDGLDNARRMLLAMLDALCASTGVPMGRVVLGGFSQGAMLTTDVTLRLEEAPAALAVFSGTVVARREWEARVSKWAGLDVLQSHGTHDPLLPYGAAITLKEMLTAAGLKVRFHSFRGGHGLDGDVIEAFATLLVEKLSSKPST